MERSYTKRRKISFALIRPLGAALFLLFIAFRILTPASTSTEPIISPQHHRMARLKATFHSDAHPTYKVQQKDDGELFWTTLHRLQLRTEAEQQMDDLQLKWSEDSQELLLFLGSKCIWKQPF